MDGIVCTGSILVSSGNATARNSNKSRLQKVVKRPILWQIVFVTKAANLIEIKVFYKYVPVCYAASRLHIIEC